jgi:ribonuclease R
MGEHCSMTERRADEATRDAVDWLKCEYMMDKVGEAYGGIITSVTGFGLFVELNDIYVEGLVHITALKNDYYHFDPAHHRLRGEHSSQTYRLGDAIQVQVARVDLDERKIDFALVDDGSEQARPPKKGRGGKKSSSRRRGGKKAEADQAEAPAKKKRSRRRGPRKAKRERKD